MPDPTAEPSLPTPAHLRIACKTSERARCDATLGLVSLSHRYHGITANLSENSSWDFKIAVADYARELYYIVMPRAVQPQLQLTIVREALFMSS